MELLSFPLSFLRPNSPNTPPFFFSFFSFVSSSVVSRCSLRSLPDACTGFWIGVFETGCRGLSLFLNFFFEASSRISISSRVRCRSISCFCIIALGRRGPLNAGASVTGSSRAIEGVTDSFLVSVTSAGSMLLLDNDGEGERTSAVIRSRED